MNAGNKKKKAEKEKEKEKEKAAGSGKGWGWSSGVKHDSPNPSTTPAASTTEKPTTNPATFSV